MTGRSILDPAIELHIEAYEEAFAKKGPANLADFMPAPDAPNSMRTAVELIRVDLELSWSRGSRKTLDDYLHLLPALADMPELRAEVAYEEYRQRKAHGERVSINEFCKKYDIAMAHWSTIVALGDETKTASSDLGLASTGLPVKSEQWRDFEIMDELGRGALSRVLLARQTTLSGRLVVLKFAPKHLLEANKLARLQHPNIVPVYSVYEDDEFHVFCMPHLGGSTLADRMTENTSDGEPTKRNPELPTLELAGKLALALAHAHERGILHNDIKPANILIDDDGQPMLLDFNLAIDATPAVQVDKVGGTLPYMSPESILGFAEGAPNTDERSDIYSLGVVLFELLAKQQPFPNCHDFRAALEARRIPARIDSLVSVSSNLSSIVDKCLAFDPKHRYQSAGDLHEDITRQIEHRPLRFASNRSVRERVSKWCRRHPRITSYSSLATIVIVILTVAAFAWHSREDHVHRMEVAVQYRDYIGRAEALVPRLSAIGLDAFDASETIHDSERLLTKHLKREKQYAALHDRYLEVTQRRELNSTVSRLAYLTAAAHLWSAQRDPTESGGHIAAAMQWNRLAGDTAVGRRKSHLWQLSRLQQLGNQPGASAALAAAHELAPVDAADLQMVGLSAYLDGDFEEALQSLLTACEQAPQDFSKWFDLAWIHARCGNWSDAETCMMTCLVLRPDSPLALYGRGLARKELRKYDASIRDFTAFLELYPDHRYGLLNRALAYKEAGDPAAALEDINQAIAVGLSNTRVLIIRSRIHRVLGDERAASDDLKRALVSSPQDAEDWVARGVAAMSRQPKRALEDFRQALALNPRNFAAMRNMAHVLSETLHQPAAAIACLDQCVVAYPNDVGAYAGRGVLLARSGEFEAAIADAKRVIQLKGDARNLLQAACIYSLAAAREPERKQQAIDLLRAAFQIDAKLAKLASKDPDLKDIRDCADFKELCHAASTLADVPSVSLLLRNGGK